MILYIKHVDIEGPETIDAFFKRHGYQGRVVDLSRGGRLPENCDDLDAVICLGGPMNVYEEDQYPFLKEENTFIQGVVRDEVPFLGICLGSQLLAKACGAMVSRSPTEEIGWRTVTLTGEGKNDPLFEGLRPDLFVFQWHGDTFAIPQNGQWLVAGPDCPHQALKVGPAAYGFQFHIEITDKSIREWSEEYFKNNPGLLKEKKAEMLAEYEKKKAAFEQEADVIYRNFLKLIVQRK